MVLSEARCVYPFCPLKVKFFFSRQFCFWGQDPNHTKPIISKTGIYNLQEWNILLEEIFAFEREYEGYYSLFPNYNSLHLINGLKRAFIIWHAYYAIYMLVNHQFEWLKFDISAKDIYFDSDV